MRAKILEGMALGKVVLSTQLGLEGIAGKHQQDVLVADTPEEIIENIAFALNDKVRLQTIGRNAREFVTENFDNLNIARRLECNYAKMLNLRQTLSE